MRQDLSLLIDHLGLFRGAVFHRGGVPDNNPLALMGRFPSLMGRFPTLMGRFPECLNGPFPLLKTSARVVTAYQEQAQKEAPEISEESLFPQ